MKNNSSSLEVFENIMYDEKQNGALNLRAIFKKVLRTN